MKLLYKEKNNENELNISEGLGNKFLMEVTNEEDAKNKRPDIYINEEWQYVIGKEIADFIFLDVGIYNVYGEDDQVKEIIYQIALLIDKEKFVIQLSQDEFYSEKWLRELKTQRVLLISKKSYQKLIKAIRPRREEKGIFENIGIHKIEGKYYYVTSDCAITAEGINTEMRSLQEGFHLEFDNRVGEESCAERFMEYTMRNMGVFYPIHCMSIMAVLRSFLKEQGISAGGVLWLDGKVSSGKTELAITAGDFFNRKGSWDDRVKHLHSPKTRIKSIERELKKYQNAVFILDDIKKEETVRNRENAKNVTDLIVRSVYMGKIGQEENGNDTVNATAIITGEFFKEQMSTVSRILYLNVGNFLEVEKNSQDLELLQRNRDYLAAFMSYFIQWLIRKVEQEEYSGKFYKMMKELTESRRKDFGGELGSRMSETVANFQFCSEVLRDYFYDISEKVLLKDQIDNFYSEGMTNILNLGRATLNRCLDYRPLISEAFYGVLSELKIKDCRYGETYLEAMESADNYDEIRKEIKRGVRCFERGESISEWELEGAKLLLLSMDYSGVLLQIQGEETLLLKVDDICNKVRVKVKENANKWYAKYYESDYTEEKILGNLLMEQWIFTHKRDDGCFDKIMKYPEYYPKKKDNGDFDIILKGLHRVVKINRKRRADNLQPEMLPMEETGKWLYDIKGWDRYTGSNSKAEIIDPLNKVLKEMNKLIDLK